MAISIDTKQGNGIVIIGFVLLFFPLFPFNALLFGQQVDLFKSLR